MYIPVNWTIIGSDDGLLLIQGQAITCWINAGILLIGPNVQATNFSESWVKYKIFQKQFLWKFLQTVIHCTVAAFTNMD